MTAGKSRDGICASLSGSFSIAVCACALLSATQSFAAEGDVLSRFYAENEGRELRRLPSWIVPENAFIGLSNPDFDDPSNATQRRLFEMFRDKSDWNVITYTLRCVPDLSSAEVQRRVAEAAKLSSDMGVELLMDIDPRIMRDEFLSRWPDDCLMIRQFANVTPDASGQIADFSELENQLDNLHKGKHTNMYRKILGAFKIMRGEGSYIFETIAKAGEGKSLEDEIVFSLIIPQQYIYKVNSITTSSFTR